jgi:hypothetical protein
VVTPLTDDMRRTLAERVESKVTGRGIPRSEIEVAVNRVANALDRIAHPSSASSGSATVIVAFASAAHPDLASRARTALERAQVAVLECGSAHAGRFTVSTFRVPASARSGAEAVAQSLGSGVRCTVVNDELARV